MSPLRRSSLLQGFARWLPMVLLGLFVAVWHMQFPPIFDDLNYERKFTEVSPKGEGTLFGGFLSNIDDRTATVGEALVSFGNHYRWVNGRLAHLFAFLLPLLPAWVTAYLNGLVMIAVMWLIVHLASLLAGHRVPPWMVALCCLVAPAWMVFRDSMLSHVFFINYFWSSAAGLAFMAAWFDPGCDTSRGWGMAACYAVVAFLAGSIHEAWGLPLAAMALFDVVLLRCRFRLSPARIALIAGLLAGVAVCSLAASNFIRADAAVASFGGLSRIFPSSLALAVRMPVGLLVLVAAIVVALCFRRGRRFVASPMVVSMLVLAVADYLISRIFNGGHRSQLPLLTSAMALVAAMALKEWPSLARPALPVWGVLTAAMAVWFGAILVEQHRQAPAHWEVYNRTIALRSQVKAGAGRPVWLPLDVPKEIDQKWWTLNFLRVPYDGPYNFERQSLLISPVRNPLTLLGDTLPVAGNAGLHGSWPYYINRRLPGPGQFTRLRVTLGPPEANARPWKRLGAPDSLVVFIDIEPVEVEDGSGTLEYGLTPGGDTLWLIRYFQPEELWQRRPLRVDLAE